MQNIATMKPRNCITWQTPAILLIQIDIEHRINKFNARINIIFYGVHRMLRSCIDMTHVLNWPPLSSLLVHFYRSISHESHDL